MDDSGALACAILRLYHSSCFSVPIAGSQAFTVVCLAAHGIKYTFIMPLTRLTWIGSLILSRTTTFLPTLYYPKKKKPLNFPSFKKYSYFFKIRKRYYFVI